MLRLDLHALTLLAAAKQLPRHQSLVVAVSRLHVL